MCIFHEEKQRKFNEINQSNDEHPLHGVNPFRGGVDRIMMLKLFLLTETKAIEAKRKKSKDKSEKRVNKAFKKFLVAVGYAEANLDECLSTFWFRARKDICEGDIYDIIDKKTALFTKSQKALGCVYTELLAMALAMSANANAQCKRTLSRCPERIKSKG